MSAAIPFVEKISPVQEIPFEQEWYEIIGKEHFWFEWRTAVGLKQLKDLEIPLERSLRILEVGCGTGLLRSALEAASQWTIDAADRNMEALKRCQPSRGRTLYYNITDEDRSLSEIYEGIILFDVLEHISDTKPFLTSILRHLAPGGFLWINVPALQTFYGSYDKRGGHTPPFKPKNPGGTVQALLLFLF